MSEKAHGDSSARNGRILKADSCLQWPTSIQEMFKNTEIMDLYVFFWIHLKSPLITTTNKFDSTFGQRFLAAIDPLSQLVDSSCDLTETPQQSLGAGERGDSDPLDPCYENYLLGALNHLKTASIVLKMYFWGLNLT